MAEDEKEENNNVEVEEETTEEEEEEEEQVVVVAVQEETPSMTFALFIYWVLPLLILAVLSRFAAITDPPPVKVSSKPIPLDLSSVGSKASAPKNVGTRPTQRPPKTKKNTQRLPVQTPTPNHPTSYQDQLDTIRKRKRKWKRPKPPSSSPPTKTKPPASSSPSSSRAKKPSANRRQESAATDTASPNYDPHKAHLEKKINEYREAYNKDSQNVWNAMYLADALRAKDLKYHDGGMGQQEALEAYHKAISLTLKKKEDLIAKGEPTNKSLSGTSSVKDELMFDYSQKSVDGLLCSIYSNMGKLYFMANMFEKAVESYSKCIEIEPLYLDAVGSRGSSLIILGKYKEAGEDFTIVMQNDEEHLFNDVFTGMAKVLAAREEVVPHGWEPMVEIIEDLIPQYESNLRASAGNNNAKKMLADALTRLYHVMFMYHDTKTKNLKAAWENLSAGYKHKMSAIPPYNSALEKQKLSTTKTVFHKAFWPDGIGSDTVTPVFIIGFVRSGSTLLERVLDAHPLIVGTGEDSVFNGRLDQIRNNIVKASMGGAVDKLHEVVEEMADSVVEDMRSRWKNIDANTASDEHNGKQIVEPKRFADKMLTNYFNVGFIHMLFPNALILHVARNPMDTIWSAFKHEFPPGGLDYTSEFNSLASMYHAYRDVMEHWDNVLPGRIMHVRYEDMVNDMPGVARAIIDATGLAWDDSVLEFHKKKHAVNTLSTTQVRKGVYKHSLEAWKKYEDPLKPLVKLVKNRVKWNLKTTLPTYRPPSQEL